MEHLDNTTVMDLVYWNLFEGCSGNPGKLLLDYVGNYTTGNCPAFWAFQEVNSWDKDNKKRLRQINEKARSTSFRFADSSSAGTTSAYDLASFSPVPELGSFALVNGLDHSAIFTELQLPGGENLMIANVHLAPRSEDKRLAEVKLLLEYYRPGTPFIIGGDLNCLSRCDNYDEAALLAQLAEVGVTKFGTDSIRYDVTGCLEAAGLVDVGAHFRDFSATVPSAFNRDVAHTAHVRVDYAFASPEALRLITSYWVVKSSETDRISDHYPIILELNTAAA